MKSSYKNMSYFFGGISIITLSFLTMRGTTQEYIEFSGIANEIAFTFFTMILGLATMVSGIPPRHWKTLRKKLFPYTIEISIKFKKKYHPTGMTWKTWNQKFRNHPNY